MPRGGYRPGAGRKPIYPDATKIKRYAFRLTPEQEKIADQLIQALRKKFAEEGKNK